MATHSSVLAWRIPGTGEPDGLLSLLEIIRNGDVKLRNLMLFAAAAKSLQSCPTLCDPIDGTHQAPPSLRFSRQEYWSGLPFPSPM